MNEILVPSRLIKGGASQILLEVRRLVDLTLQAAAELNYGTDNVQAPDFYSISIPREGKKAIKVKFPRSSLDKVRTSIDQMGGKNFLEQEIGLALRITNVIVSCTKIFWKQRIFKEEVEGPLMAAGMLFYLPLVLDGRWVEYIKYAVCRRFVESEFPETHAFRELPEGIQAPLTKEKFRLLPGEVGRLIFSKCLGGVREGRRSISWRWTLLQGLKKGLPHAPSEFILQTARKHKSTLEKETKISDNLREYVERFVKRFVEDIGGPILYDQWANRDIQGISSNSCYEATRSQGGNAGVLRLLAFCPQDEVRRKLLRYYRNDQVSNDFFDEEFTEGERESLEYQVCTAPPIIWQMGHFPGDATVTTSYRPGWQVDFQDDIRFLQDLSISNEIKGYSFAKFILEPLKVRTITAGSIVTNGLYQPLQKLLWKAVHKFRPFELIGKEMSKKVVKDIVEESEDFVKRFVNDPDFKYWCSADYSGATDNLKAEISRIIIRGLSGDPITHSVLERGMMDNTIRYSTEGKKMGVGHISDVGLNECEQVNGQLMGCVFSFPILCLANMAAYCLSVAINSGYGYNNPGDGDPYLRLPCKWYDLPVRINGDDCLFKCSGSLYRTWEKTIRAFGFFKSTGKNYCKEDLIIINSSMYKNFSGTWELIPYVNMGWATGVKKGGECEVGRVKVESKGKVLEPLVSLQAAYEAQCEHFAATGWTKGVKFWDETLFYFKAACLHYRKDAAISTKLFVGNAGPMSFGCEDVRPVEYKNNIHRAFSHWLLYNSPDEIKSSPHPQSILDQGFYALEAKETAQINASMFLERWDKFKRWAGRAWNSRKLEFLGSPGLHWTELNYRPYGACIATKKLMLGLDPFNRWWSALELRQQVVRERVTSPLCSTDDQRKLIRSNWF